MIEVGPYNCPQQSASAAVEAARNAGLNGKLQILTRDAKNVGEPPGTYYSLAVQVR